MRRDVLGVAGQLQLDRHRIEPDAIENACDPVRRRVDAKTRGADRARADQHEAAGAVFEILQRLAIGFLRIGMIDSRHHLPRRTRRASGERTDIGPSLVKRLDAQAVIGLGDQLLVERRTFEDAVDQLQPLLTGRGREFGGEGKVGHMHLAGLVRGFGNRSKPFDACSNGCCSS
jgi:hypothetical protein